MSSPFNVEKSRRTAATEADNEKQAQAVDSLVPIKRAPKLGKLKKKDTVEGEIFMSTDVDEDNSFTFGDVSGIAESLTGTNCTPCNKRAPRLRDLPRTPSIVKGDKVVLMSIEIEEEQSFDFDDMSSIEGEANNDVTAVEADDYL
ncbi:unnamed protein product [Oikopleura dioica]|uniref:Uncharacterized protein n=1 Tax=Oikopleura dioica TaxID=34765 RepID=E4WX99_OIKDI|nr:unnamed protein product [Oikopleura dioica]